MYCPTPHMNHKIAEVKIAVGTEVERFCDYERKHNNQLSGGHLDAQMKRFGRLWRTQFFVEREQLAALSADVRSLLIETIERLALGYIKHDDEQSTIVRRLARQLVLSEDSPWHEEARLMNSEHSSYDDAHWKDVKHYFALLWDYTFDCLATGFDFDEVRAPLPTVLERLAADIGVSR